MDGGICIKKDGCKYFYNTCIGILDDPCATCSYYMTLQKVRDASMIMKGFCEFVNENNIINFNEPIELNNLYIGTDENE